MALLSIANLSHAFGDLQILEGVNLTVEHGEHVALVGRNGCGKSTLLKIVAGLPGYRHDDGQVQFARGASAGYLSQEPELDPGRTLREEAHAAFEGLHKLHERLDTLTHKMAEADGDTLDSLLQEYESVQQKVEAAGGYAVDHKIEATLHGLGLGDETFDVRVGDLSGGQRGRLALAKLLLQAPDLLLLVAGRDWLLPARDHGDRVARACAAHHEVLHLPRANHFNTCHRDWPGLRPAIDRCFASVGSSR